MTAGVGAAAAPASAARGGRVLGALLVAAVLVDLGGFHGLEHGDSIVPVLVSLVRWTPFYWEQERFGMLVPLLALPVKDPLSNLLLQRALGILAGLAALVLLARHVLPARDWPLCGAVAVAGLLALPSGGWAFEYLADQPYGVSLALALAGLSVAEPGPSGRRSAWRLAAGLLLVLAAHWVNASIGVVLGFLALARAAEDLLAGEPRREVAGRLVVDAGLLAAGLAAGLAMFRAAAAWLGHTRRVAEGFLPLAGWPASWATLLRKAVADEGAWLAGLSLAALAGVALLSVPALRPVRRQALWRAATLAAAAVLWFGFAGTLEWVAGSSHHWRYVIPSMLLLHLAAASLLAEPLSRTARLAGPALAAALLAIPVAAVAAWGPPSLAGVKDDLARVTGRHAEEVLLARCDLLTGDYWSVWPTLWRVEQLTRERGEGRRVYAVCHRGTPTMPAWAGRPRAELRICRPRTRAAEVDGQRWLELYGLWPVELLERWPTLDVVGPVGAPHPGPAP